MKYERCTLETTQVNMSEPSSVVTLTSDLLIPKYIDIFLSPSCIYVWKQDKSSYIVHEIWKLYFENYSSYRVLEPKFWKKSVVTLTSDFLTPKYIGIFLAPSCIFVWNMKLLCCKQLKLSRQNQSVDKAQLWPWPLTSWPPKMYRCLPLITLNLVCESSTLKTN